MSINKKVIILFIFIPLSFFISYLNKGDTLIFISSAVAIIPLAMFMTSITSKLASYIGNSWGGLLNVTFGNATELIISIFAILNGLLSVVKAEITGSIIMNLLLVPGISFFAGGLKYRTQSFDKLLAITNSAMLMLAGGGMLIPAIFYFASPNIKTIVLGKLSIGVAAILLFTYMASLYFTLFIHEKEKNEKKKEVKNKTLIKEIVFLLLITILISYEAKSLVSSIEGISRRLNISQTFIGVIILPLLANVAENYTAIKMARKNNIDMSINIAIGSSIQIALFLVPVLIFLSHLIGRPMNVLFNILEVSAIFMAVLAVNIVYLQGKSNWFEGLQLFAFYLIIALAFYFA